VGAGEDNVGALRCERKVIFEQHLDVAEAGIGKVRGQGWEAALPRELQFGTASALASAQPMTQASDQKDDPRSSG
jgi:hypothetical protein